MQLSAGPFQRIISLRMTEDMLEQLRAAQEQDGHGNGNGCAWSVELSGEKRGNVRPIAPFPGHISGNLELDST